MTRLSLTATLRKDICQSSGKWKGALQHQEHFKAVPDVATQSLDTLLNSALQAVTLSPGVCDYFPRDMRIGIISRKSISDPQLLHKLFPKMNFCDGPFDRLILSPLITAFLLHKNKLTSHP